MAAGAKGSNPFGSLYTGGRPPVAKKDLASINPRRPVVMIRLVCACGCGETFERRSSDVTGRGVVYKNRAHFRAYQARRKAAREMRHG